MNLRRTSFFENVPFSTKIGEIKALSLFENGKRALSISRGCAPRVRAGLSGGSPSINRTCHIIHYVFTVEAILVLVFELRDCELASPVTDSAETWKPSLLPIIPAEPSSQANSWSSTMFEKK